MMFDIKRSEKNHIEGKEQFIAVLNNVVYFRIVGEEGDYVVMTATAGEDYPGTNPFNDQDALISAALNVAGEFDARSSVKYDFHTRAYVTIGPCLYISDAHRFVQKVFERLQADGSNSNPE